MRFITLYRPAKLTPPTAENMCAMGEYIDELKKAGVLLATDGAAPGGKTVQYKLSKGKFTVTDGPFAEGKEVIGGFALLEVSSIEQLTEVCRRFLDIAGEGTSEALQVFGG